jgi:phenylpropionate dioxygenase-like ring-hydroxylating dioxygenase large terminal subunit
MAWVPVGRSDSLHGGEVLGADVGDRELVVWRTSSGRVCVMDARCPHQWSYLGAEGVVDGDELVCAAHHWRFAPDGCGTKLNLFGRRDPKADIEVFPAREHDGCIEVELSD